MKEKILSSDNREYRRKHKELTKELLSISDVSYYRWKKDRPIFKLLEKYFSNEELEEFLKEGKIDRLELCNDVGTDYVSKDEFNEALRKIEHLENIFKETIGSGESTVMAG